MRKLIESTLVSVDGVMGSPELWSPFDEESRRVAMDELGKDLIKYATSRVDDTLLRAGLVDEIRVWVMPVVVGTGQRLFEGIDTSSLQLTLTDVHRLANGSVILTYTPNHET